MPTHSSPFVHPDTAGITEKKHLNLLRELPGPWHLFKPKLGPIQSVQGTPPLLFTGELREVFQTESDGRLSSFTLPLGGP